MDRSWIKDMEVGDSVKGTYAVSAIHLRTYSNGEFLSLRLADRTGKISGVYWEGSQELFRRIPVGTIVRVDGKVGRYQGQLQLSLSSIVPLAEGEGGDKADFLPVGPCDPEQLIQKLKQWKDSLAAEHYRKLWDCFFEDQALFEKFSSAPAGKQWHHPYLGGLLEHTESLIQLCDRIAQQYPYLKRDLLLTGALFHDAAKALELVYHTTFEYSDEGRLVGHIVMGAAQVRGYVEQVADFPREEGLLLQHLILAHQGETDESPRKPRCREALALHLADMIDSQLAAFTREIEKPELAGQRWTPYVNLISRYLYRGAGDEAAEGTDKEA